MSIQRHTLSTSDGVLNKLDDAYSDVTGKNRILLREYGECLLRYELQHKAHVMWLLNPIHANQSGDWHDVHTLIEDKAHECVPLELREKIAGLESQLKEAGVL